MLILSCFIKPAELIPVPETIKEEEPMTAENQKFDLINGNNSEFYIVRPDETKLDTVTSDAFGMSPDLYDNTDAFMSAAAYLENNPGTRLVISDGTYYFDQSDRIRIRNLNTCFIDGRNAKFIFRKTGTFLRISACDCLEIFGLKIDADRINNPVDDVLRIKNADRKKHIVDFEFFEKANVSENMIFSAITQCDPDTLTFGACKSSKECYIYMDPETVKSVAKISDNVLRVTHNGSFDNFADGETYILRHHVYDGCVFQIDGASRNLTFDNVNIFGSYGSGYSAGDLTNHWQIINSTIGVDPDDTTGAHVSQGADGIHIAGSGGFFNLENCDFSGQGDDALNVHDGIGYVYEVSGNTLGMYSSQTRLNIGEALAFKDNGFNETGFSAEIVSFETGGPLGTEKRITFDRDISDAVRPGYIAYSTTTNSGNYVIRNNYFHENRARALLLQSDNGICENNRFYKTQGQAIKIVMDIRPALWQEGTGVNNLIIRNNDFDSCDYSAWGEQITVDTYINGDYADCCVFKNIEITDNSFRNCNSKIINAMNVNGLVFTGNRIDASDIENRVYLQDHCENVAIENEYTGKFADIASIVKTRSAKNFIMQNGKINGTN